MLKLRIYETKT